MSSWIKTSRHRTEIKLRPPNITYEVSTNTLVKPADNILSYKPPEVNIYNIRNENYRTRY